MLNNPLVNKNGSKETKYALTRNENETYQNTLHPGTAVGVVPFIALNAYTQKEKSLQLTIQTPMSAAGKREAK